MSANYRVCIFLIAGWVASACPVASAQTGDAEDQAVYYLLKKNCTKCHDDLPATQAGGDVNDLLDLETLATSYLDPADEDYLDELVMGSEARMPKPTYGEVEWNGPLSKAEKQTLRKWLERGCLLYTSDAADE